MENKTALIIGATGLVGKFCLSYLLNENAYERVIAISRKPIGFTHPKLNNIVCDFDHLAKHQAEIKADDIYCCLGTTIAVAGSREAFTKVDYTYPLQVAQMAKQNGATQFLLVSALGADKNSKIFYSKIKGELEEAIQKLNFNSTYIFQPSLLSPLDRSSVRSEAESECCLPLQANLVGSASSWDARQSHRRCNRKRSSRLGSSFR